MAKAKPADLNYSSAVTGGASHLAAELFKSMAGVNITRIPDKTGNIEIPGFGAEFLTGFYALSTTPPAIIDRLNQEAVRFLNQC